MSALPNELPRPAGELEALETAWRAPRGWRRLTAVNNTQIGLYYIATAMAFFVLAGVLALVMRAQLAVPDNTLVDAGLYNQLFTMHGTVMMFLFAVPAVEAVAVFLLPGMLGARDLPFPRLSAYAYWAYALGGAAFFCTLFFRVAPDGGWFMLPPLTGAAQSPGLGADFWLLGIGFIEISAIAGAVELIVGILYTRAPGMTLARMPVFAWAMLVVALMIVFAFPAVIAGTALLELERAFDWPFFIPERGGDPLLWQHLFWFFGHPEVYIIFLPAAGLVSMLVPELAGVALVGRRWVVGGLVGAGVLSFLIWAHHMFTAGLGPLARSLASAASLAIVIPTAIQVFAWLATLWRGRLRLNAAGLFLIGFFFVFVLGGLTGVMVALLPFDLQVHDSYFVVAHLHYVLIGGMVFPLFAAFYHWGPLVNGRCLSEPHARWVFALMFGGFNLAFFPMHLSGLAGMPRRVYTYAGDLGWNLPNLLSTVGAAVLAAGVALFLADALSTWGRPRQPHGNPWRAGTLEWLPAGDYGTRSIPQVRSARPLHAQPALPREVRAGGHWLPGSATGARETLATSPRDARITHLIVLPGDSVLPLTAAAGTAGFFLLLTVGQAPLAWLCGAAALAATWAWLWQTDRPPPQVRVAIGRDTWIPVGAVGRRSHAWWGTLVVVVVDVTVFASLAFAHLHVAMAAAVCPPPGASLPPAAWAGAAAAAWGVAALAYALAPRLAVAGGRATLAVAVASAAACAGFALTFEGQRAAALAPAADAWSATVAALVGYEGLHAAALLLMGAYLLARALSGRLTPRARAPLDVISLLGVGAALQALAAAALVQGTPRWLG